MTGFPKVPSMLPRNRPLRLAVIITIVGVIAYAMGALMHSEIWHFFMDALEEGWGNGATGYWLPATGYYLLATSYEH